MCQVTFQPNLPKILPRRRVRFEILNLFVDD